MEKYISAEAAAENLRNYKIERDLMVSHNDTIDFAISVISREVAPADVRPVAEISDAVDEAIDFLNSVYSQMPYHVYSALFDLICGICPNCGADMRGEQDG